METLLKFSLSCRRGSYPSNPLSDPFFFFNGAGQDLSTSVLNPEFSVSGGIYLLHRNKPAWLKISIIPVFYWVFFSCSSIFLRSTASPFLLLEV